MEGSTGPVLLKAQDPYSNRENLIEYKKLGEEDSLVCYDLLHDYISVW